MKNNNLRARGTRQGSTFLHGAAASRTQLSLPAMHRLVLVAAAASLSCGLIRHPSASAALSSSAPGAATSLKPDTFQEEFLITPTAARIAVGSTSGEIDIEDSRVKPVLVRQNSPTYPEAARKNGQGGTVVAEIHVDRRGRVARVRVLDGAAAPFDAPSVEAIRQWQFLPLRIQGSSVPWKGVTTIRFLVEVANLHSVEIGPWRVATSRERLALIHGATYQPPPSYPRAAMATGASGTVTLAAVVGGDGNVRHVDIVHGDEPFSSVSVAVVKTWQYEPFLANGKASEWRTEITFEFRASRVDLATPGDE